MSKLPKYHPFKSLAIPISCRFVLCSETEEERIRSGLGAKDKRKKNQGDLLNSGKNFFAIILHTYTNIFVTFICLVGYTDFKYRANLH